jgi:hypothetical protein
MLVRRTLLLALAAAAACMAAGPAIDSGSKLYIEPMDQGLDALIRAQIFEKKVPVQIVLDVAQADYVLTGFASDERDRKWHEGWLTARKESATGAVSLVTKDGGSVVWAMEASDKNRLWGVMASEGHRKVAKKIADGLKKIVK